MTLRPGDLILTGTPPGVGVFRKPPEFLKVTTVCLLPGADIWCILMFSCRISFDFTLQRGDVVECEIEGIGKVVNKIV